MTNSYAWVISQLECYPEFEGKTNVVFIVHWERQATDSEGHKGNVCGAQQIVLSPDKPFTPFEQLTKVQVEQWLVDAMGEAVIAAQDALLDAQIKSQIAPEAITPPLPWA